MEPLSILIWTAVWAGVSLGIYATVYFSNLTFQIVHKWFLNFSYLMVANDRRSSENRENIAFTVQKAMQSGDYNIVQGIFDNRTGDVRDARVIQAGSVDTTIKQAHSNGRKEVVFWQ